MLSNLGTEGAVQEDRPWFGGRSAPRKQRFIPTAAVLAEVACARNGSIRAPGIWRHTVQLYISEVRQDVRISVTRGAGWAVAGNQRTETRPAHGTILPLIP